MLNSPWWKKGANRLFQPGLARRTPPARFRPCLEPLEGRTLLNGGMLDPAFGNGGKVTTDFLAPLDAVPAADVIQPDGKILVVGTAQGDVYGHFALARYNTHRSLHTT